MSQLQRVAVLHDDHRENERLRQALQDHGLLDCTGFSHPLDLLTQSETFDALLWWPGLLIDDLATTIRLLRGSQDAPLIALLASNQRAEMEALMMAGVDDCFVQQEAWTDSLDACLHRAYLRHQGPLGKYASHDLLTGVPRGTLVLPLLRQGLRRASRFHSPICLFLVSLGAAHERIQQLGPLPFEHLLRQVSIRLRQSVRSEDLVARLSATEFIIISEQDIGSPGPAAQLKALQQALETPLFLHEQELNVGAQVSAVVAPATTRDEQSLLREARRRLAGEPIKAPAQSAPDPGEQELSAAFRRALRAEALALRYHVGRRHGEHTACWFASDLYWQHPAFGTVGAEQVMRVASRAGLLVPLGYWMLKQVCEDLVRLAPLYDDSIYFSLNWTLPQFLDRRFVQTVTQIITRADVPPQRLVFALTEGCLLFDPRRSGEQLRELTALGIAFMLDDPQASDAALRALHGQSQRVWLRLDGSRTAREGPRLLHLDALSRRLGMGQVLSEVALPEQDPAQALSDRILLDKGLRAATTVDALLANRHNSGSG